MLLALAAASWLLAAGVAGATLPRSGNGLTDPLLIDDREQYFQYAKNHGMCRKYPTEINENRILAIPGKSVLAPFSVCVARNEFGHKLQDRSGKIFCEGETIHLMADAMNHTDSKEFVDKASTLDGSRFTEEVSSYIKNTGNLTVKMFREYIDSERFGLQKPGVELNYYNNSRFPSTPAFISEIRPQARILRAWIKIVHHYWNNLDRTMNQTYGKDNYLLPGPGSFVKHEPEEEKYSSSLIRLEHPFVIAGGRFREQYYWDAFFIMEGLLSANMGYLARTTLLNFMDQIKAYGFIPNGGRKYYLNRSQPPLFIHMLHLYVNKTSDTHILHEALPLAERELHWWSENRSVKVNTPRGSHTVYRYNVDATGPRPESYGEDWRSAWCYGEKAPEPEAERDLYSELASGAESGWDYTVRWMKNPYRQHEKSVSRQMIDLRIRSTIPVDLNSIIYRCHVLMAEMYRLARDDESPFHDAYVNAHESKASALREAILALHWDARSLAFFDFVLNDHKSNSGKINKFWSGASLAPYWVGIWPKALSCDSSRSKNATMRAFSGVRDLLSRYPGPLPATVVESKQQWDFPNAWPPLQYIAIKALQNVDAKCMVGTNVHDFAVIQRPPNHLGAGKLPQEVPTTPKINYATSPSWRDVLVKTVAMRYINAAFCTWNVKGQFPPDRVEHIVGDSPARSAALFRHPGYMFEKLNAKSATQAGGGGEYEVQTGFGWTNGVAIWIAQQFGDILDAPNCGTAPQTTATDPDMGGPLLFQP